MSQVSYGTITITDTTDIERIYPIYCKGDLTNAPSISGATNWNNWKELISQAGGTGDYIWQRIVTKKVGIEITYNNASQYCSDAVRLTGEAGVSPNPLTISSTQYAQTQNENDTPSYGNSMPSTINEGWWLWVKVNYSDGNSTVTKIKQGQKGDTGISVTGIKEIYFLKRTTDNIPTAPGDGVNTTSTSTAGGVWTTVVPDYVTGGVYYTSIQTSYSGGTSPKSSPAVINQGLTDANTKAFDAYNTSTARDTEINAIKAQAKHYWWDSQGAHVAAGENTISVDNITQGTPSTYGFNSLMAPGYLALKYKDINFAQLATNSLTFYRPATNGSTYVQGKKGMDLTADALTFYKPLAYNSSSEPTSAMRLTDSSFRLGLEADNHTTIDTNGLHIWAGTESTATNEVAEFGSIVRIGKKDKTSVYIDNGEINLYDAREIVLIPIASYEFSAQTSDTVTFSGSYNGNYGSNYVLKYNNEIPQGEGNTYIFSYDSTNQTLSVTCTAAITGQSATFEDGDVLNLYVEYIDALARFTREYLRIGPRKASHIEVDSSGLNIYNDDKQISYFGENKVVVGENANGKSRAVLSANGMQVYMNKNGESTQIANLGYGPTQGESGPTTSPYYDLGIRTPNTTKGAYSVAEGYEITASGYYSHAEGWFTIASGQYSHAEGNGATASGHDSHAEGTNTTASGLYSHAEGFDTTASGQFSHAEGRHTTVSGYYSHAEGFDTTASGNRAHAEGEDTTASGYYSHAEGWFTTASGESSHAEGYATTASDYSHAEGYGTTASGYSHAEGDNTTAEGLSSHAEGWFTTASGESSHAEGRDTIARGESSHAEGHGCQASGDWSHAGGYYTLADSDYQTAIGKYNSPDMDDTYALIIGNGTGPSAADRSDAFTVGWDGNVTAAGSITAGGLPSGLLAEDVVLADNKTISGNNYGNDSASVAKSGYTPIGIVGMRLQNATSSGTLNTYCMLHSFYLSGTTAYWIVRNTNSGAAKIKVTATILYVKL